MAAVGLNSPEYFSDCDGKVWLMKLSSCFWLFGSAKQWLNLSWETLMKGMNWLGDIFTYPPNLNHQKPFVDDTLPVINVDVDHLWLVWRGRGEHSFDILQPGSVSYWDACFPWVRCFNKDWSSHTDHSRDCLPLGNVQIEVFFKLDCNGLASLDTGIVEFHVIEIE